MRNVTFREYCRVVQKVSFNVQYLEELLKVYLGMCFDVVELSLNKRLFFGFSYEDVKNLSLGRLIEGFSKYNGNKRLLKLLRDLVKERNHIAHKAYLLTTEEIHDSDILAKEFERVVKISERVVEAHNAVFDEGRIVESLVRELEKGFPAQKKVSVS